jgi:hypothetical protein
MLSSRFARITLASAVVALSYSALVVGCAAPEGKFDEFVDRYKQIHETTSSSTSGGGEGGGGGGGGGGGSMGGCTLPKPGAIDGDFFFSLSVPLNPETPVVFKTTVTTAAMGDGLSVTMKIQALKAADRKSPTGPVITLEPFEVGANGNFVANLPTLTVPGDADPFFPGTAIEATITLSGSLCKADDFVCGLVTGNVTKPAPGPLDGSTFGMVRITNPSSYPAALYDCARDEAPPP